MGEAPIASTATTTFINTEVENEEAKSESDSYNEEYYDDQGRYIWGEQGKDWEFYDQEDAEAYEKGLSTISNTLNPQALPVEFNPYVDQKTGVAVSKVKAQI